MFIVRKKSALADEFVKMVLSRAIESNIQPSVLGAGQVGRGNEGMKTYRKGAIGALMDEYERATTELKLLVEQTADDDFIQVLDPRTEDEDCRSIQTIVTHVVRAGFGYANYIRDCFSIATTRSITGLLSRQDVVVGLDEMLDYMAQTLEGKWEMREEEITGVVINSRWGVRYDLEQLLEHAIVHILRHRRQIERLLQESKVSARTGV